MPGDRIAFDHFTGRRTQIPYLRDEIGENIPRQKVAFDNKAVAIELPTVRVGDSRAKRRRRASPSRQAMRRAPYAAHVRSASGCR